MEADMLAVPNQLQSNLQAWKSNPNTSSRLPATVLPPFGPPKHQLGMIETAKQSDNNPALDSDPRDGVVVHPETGDTVTLSTQGSREYFQEVKADGKVTGMLSNEHGIYKVSYWKGEGQSEYSATQSFVPMSGEGWVALRDVGA